MKILVICQYYYPENFQINSICEQMVRDGNDVFVVTGIPNYPTGIVPEGYRHKRIKYEEIRGVRVRRTFEIPRKNHMAGLALNYLSYCISASCWAGKNTERFDRIFIYQLSPVLMAYPGMIVKRKQKIPILLYCCDLWPESMKTMIKNEHSFIFKWMTALSRKLYSSADHIAVQSKSFISYLNRVHNIDEKKLCYIPAFANESYLNMNLSAENDCMDFVFLGNIGRAQDIDTILEAVKKIKDEERFVMHFVGNGSCLQEAKKYVKSNALEHIVKFYGRRAADEMPEFYRLADVCVVTLKADSAVGRTLPSKVQEYMAAGKPILAALEGSAREVILEARCGICVPPGDPDAFADAMRYFIREKEGYEAYGANGRMYFKNHFTKGNFMRLLYKQFEDLGDCGDANI